MALRTQRPTISLSVGGHERRIRVLERLFHSGTSGPRVVYGRIYNDATIMDAGSGDWSVDSAVGTATITFDSPFTEGYAFVCTPNDNGDSIPDPPQLQPIVSVPYSMSGFVMGYQIDLATVAIVFWDLDGNFNYNRCGFDFEAVGT